MADNDKQVMSSCPICGYTDSSTDPSVLEESIKDHIRTSHNLDPAGMINSNSVKPAITNNQTSSTEPPAAAPVANIGTSPSGAMALPNIGNEDRGGAPGDPDTQARNS